LRGVLSRHRTAGSRLETLIPLATTLKEYIEEL